MSGGAPFDPSAFDPAAFGPLPLARVNFYARDFLLETRDLSDRACGLLVRLMAAMTARGGPLPYDEAALIKAGAYRNVRSLRLTLGELLDNGRLMLLEGSDGLTYVVDGPTVCELARSRRRSRDGAEDGRDASRRWRRRANVILARLRPGCYRSDRHAGVAELVDALDSKSSSGNRVSVRVRPPAPAYALRASAGRPTFAFELAYSAEATASAAKAGRVAGHPPLRTGPSTNRPAPNRVDRGRGRRYVGRWPHRRRPAPRGRVGEWLKPVDC